ncbi:MAG TPA: protease, partial [Verrucomicrobiae bacterium]|nr:protease [Verrucomicrobiae bacterium]
MTKSVPAKLFLSSVLFVVFACCSFGDAKTPLLLQTPTISKDQIAFVYGGDIWIVGKDGGQAHRLVTGRDLESGPIFSPDGSRVAFSGNYDSNVDVYVVPSTGGEPRRLTYHPGDDIAIGWTPDGKNVLFHSHRNSTNDPDKLFTVPASGGFPTELPLDMAEEGSYSPDGSQIAYVPVFQWEPDWKGYRGGQTTPVWIAKLADSSVVKVPREDSNDRNPMWIGKTVYFLSDRDGPTTLFAYDTETQKVSRVVDNKNGFGISSASADARSIVYSQFGALHVYDLSTRQDKAINVTVSADMPQLLPHWEKVAKHILNSGVSPSGARAVFEAHGEILTVPAEKGDVRDITNSPGAADRDPAWSPDGKSIAYFSDVSGEYQLYVRDQKGLEPARKISLSSSPSFYYSPTWSPDSKKIAYSDKFLNLWYVDVDHPTPVKVDQNLMEFNENDFGQQWSPDSQWIVYTKVLPNYLHAVFVYSVATRKGTQITDGMSDCRYPGFDKDGKYIYFAASTNTGLTAAGFDMSSDDHPVTLSVYVAVLRKDLPSPAPPESDEEKGPESKPSGTEPEKGKTEQKVDEKKTGDEAAAKAAEKPKEPPKVSIDFPDILQRILSLPIPAANYASMSVGKEGELFLVEAPIVPTGQFPPPLTVS